MPLVVERGEGTAHELGRAAAARALLGVGLGLDARGACAVLAAAPAARVPARRRSQTCARSRRTQPGSRGAARCGAPRPEACS